MNDLLLGPLWIIPHLTSGTAVLSPDPAPHWWFYSIVSSHVRHLFFNEQNFITNWVSANEKKVHITENPISPDSQNSKFIRTEGPKKLHQKREQTEAVWSARELGRALPSVPTALRWPWHRSLGASLWSLLRSYLALPTSSNTPVREGKNNFPFKYSVACGK